MGLDELTRLWILYLKSSQIVWSNSDPTTGELSYRRKVDAHDITQFLKLKTDFSDKDIKNAISSVNASDNSVASDNKSVALATDDDTANNQQSQQQSPTNTPANVSRGPDGNAQRTKKYDTSDATDIEPRYGPRTALPYQDDNSASVDEPSTPQLPHSPNSKPADLEPNNRSRTGGTKAGNLSQTPDAIRKRKSRAEVSAKTKSGKSAFSHMASSLSNKVVKEAFSDKQAEVFSEKDVEEIFQILTNKQSTNQDGENVSTGNAQDTSVLRQKEIAQIKKVIRDSMNDQQRMTLWRALNDQED